MEAGLLKYEEPSVPHPLSAAYINNSAFLIKYKFGTMLYRNSLIERSLY